jgi:voltage-gated potassium channel
MNSWRRIRIGSIISGIVLVAAVLGYCVLGRDPLDALYMVIITISSIGYTEQSNLPAIEKGFTILVIIFGMSAAAYALGGLVQLMTEGEIARALGLRRLTKEIERLSDHIIVCGFGRIGHFVAEELHRHEQPFALVEHSAERVAEAQSQGYLVLNGDAREEDVLQAVGVRRAKTLVTALNSDADNVFITLTSRELNPNLHIIARGELPSTRKKLLQAGANRVVLPAAIGAQRMAAMITRPSTVELLELVTGRGVMDVALDGLRIGDSSPIVGQTVQTIEARKRFSLLVVAVKRASGDMSFNPDEKLRFAGGDTIILMGRVEDIERFRVEYQL